MKRTIVFATSNKNKVKEVKEMLAPLDIDLLTLKDLNLEITAIETETTFEGNALIKARDIASKCSYPVLADDSGLSIEAFGGFPGVHSARFMEGQPYPDKCQALIRMLENDRDRKASYFDAMVYIDSAKKIEKTVVGRTDGEITKTYDENAPYGFGYDPIFYSYELKKTFGRSTPSEKDSISHRGRALQQMLDFLRTLN
ncbi:MAG: RdgB/HAM1 family non-canonical purine NTP pyrophosphatase [Bacilli bacterium]|jgi:XTP/dITP diphosphohydrolase